MIRLFGFTSAAVLLLTVAAPAAQPVKAGPCQNPRIQWDLKSSYTADTGGIAMNFISAITGDGNVYADGSGGVSASIQACSGSGDAKFQLQNSSKRTIKFNLANRAATNSATPSWATGLISGHGDLTVRSLTYVPTGSDRSGEYEFTTWLGSSLPAPYDSWHLHMYNPSAVAETVIPGVPNFATANSPFIEAAVIVHHCGANSTATTGPCVGRIKETWIVYPDPNQTSYANPPGPASYRSVGGLMNGTNASAPINAGQFSMPFYFVISIL